MFNKEDYFVKTFESFIDNALFEASNLNQMGLPQEMIKAIQSKKEHISDKYPNVGHMYYGGIARPLPHKYFQPDSKIDIPEPTKLFGYAEIGSPFGLDTDSESAGVKTYTDLIWFLRSIPRGECRVFIVHPKSNFFMFIYNKVKSIGATGSQYSVMGWDPSSNELIDYGSSELTTNAVDRRELRKVHDRKGGNTVGKVQEYVMSRLTETISRPGKADKDYTFGQKEWAAANRETPLLAYVLDIEGKVRDVRSTRTEGKINTSMDILPKFAKKLSNIIDLKSSDKIKNALISLITANQSNTYIVGSKIPQEITELSEKLDIPASNVLCFLFLKFKDFRKELFEEGRYRVKGGESSYDTTSGYELEEENKIVNSTYGLRYDVQYQTYDPNQQQDDLIQRQDDEDEDPVRAAKAEQYKRRLPAAGEYASIQSIIKNHVSGKTDNIDPILSMFLAYIMKDVVKNPVQNFSAVLAGSTKSKPEFKRPGETSKPSDLEDEDDDNLLY